MAEQTIKFDVEVDARGIDTSIRSTQRLLYFMNSLRLSVTDVERFMKSPTIPNLLMMSIQLTQNWTTLVRFVKQVNLLARGGAAADFLGGFGGYGLGGMGGRAVSRAIGGRFATGQQTLMGGAIGAVAGTSAVRGLLTTAILAMLALPPTQLALIGVAVVMGAGAIISYQQERAFDEYRSRMREIAKSQGLEY